MIVVVPLYFLLTGRLVSLKNKTRDSEMNESTDLIQLLTLSTMTLHYEDKHDVDDGDDDDDDDDDDDGDCDEDEEKCFSNRLVVDYIV